MTAKYKWTHEAEALRLVETEALWLRKRMRYRHSEAEAPQN